MDIEYLAFLQNIRLSYGGEYFFRLVSDLVKYFVIIPSILFWCINKKAGIFVLFNATIGLMFTMFLKGTFCVYRPWIRDNNLIPDIVASKEFFSYSFPSNHTQLAMAIFGGTSYFYRNMKRWLIIPCVLSVVLVAFSRNYLGMHTPQDVLTPMFVSIILFVLAEKLFSWIGEDTKRRQMVLVGGSIICVVVFLWLYFKSYPEDFLNDKLIVKPSEAQKEAFDALGISTAFFIGWFLEQEFVDFKTDVINLKWKIFRVLIGLAVLGILNVLILPSLEDFFNSETRIFLKNFLPFFSILFVVPVIFTKVEQKFLNR